MEKFLQKNLNDLGITEDIIESLVIDMEEKIKEKESVYNNYDYINWLDEFTSKHSSFHKDSFLYDESISDEDKNNVEKLDYLFECIDKYASNNGISPICYDDVSFGNVNYRFMYNNKHYEIGVMTGQGSSVSLSTIYDNNNYGYIDFNNIVKTNNKTYIKK